MATKGYCDYSLLNLLLVSDRRNYGGQDPENPHPAPELIAGVTFSLTAYVPASMVEVAIINLKLQTNEKLAITLLHRSIRYACSL
jgi:hypothetical protein